MGSHTCIQLIPNDLRFQAESYRTHELLQVTKLKEEFMKVQKTCLGWGV